MTVIVRVDVLIISDCMSLSLYVRVCVGLYVVLSLLYVVVNIICVIVSIVVMIVLSSPLWLCTIVEQRIVLETIRPPHTQSCGLYMRLAD